MFNTIIITVKTLLRRPSTWVWGALFPIALSTMFMFMFANLSSDGTVDPVPVAVVADEAWDASTFKDVEQKMITMRALHMQTLCISLRDL